MRQSFAISSSEPLAVSRATPSTPSRFLVLICCYFTWVAAQNLVLPVLYNTGMFSTEVIAALIGVKELILVLGLVFLAGRVFHPQWRWLAADRAAIFYISVLSVFLIAPSLVASGTLDWEARLISYRTLSAVVFFYLFGRLACLTKGEVLRLASFIVLLQVLIAVFGLAELTLLPASFWSEEVGVGAYLMEVKGLTEGINVIDGMPSNAYRFGMRRLMSVYGDPLALGIACTFPLVLALVVWQQKDRDVSNFRLARYAGISAVVIGAALVFSIARESMATAAFAILLISILQRRIRVAVVMVFVIALALTLFDPVREYAIDTVTFQEESAATHLSFLLTNLENAPGLLIGAGLGEAGGWSVSRYGVETEIGENAYAELMAQCGIGGVLALLLFLALLVRRLNELRRSRVISGMSHALFVALLATWVSRALTTNFSPAIFNVTATAAFAFLTGAALTAFEDAAAEPRHAAGRNLARVIQGRHLSPREGQA